MRFFLLFNLLLLLSLLIACSSEDPRSYTSSYNLQMPEFSLKDINGNIVHSKDLKGKIILIDFWTTWCMPCRMEIPHLIKLQEKYAKKGFTVLGINLENKKREVIKAFAQKNKINYPILMGDQKTAGKFGSIQSIPTAFLIDKEGNINSKFVGYKKQQVFERAIERLLD